MSVASLRRLRWAVRATLALGVAVSVTANVLHARHDPIAQAIAAWPPLAPLITVDLVSRVPIHRRLLGAVRIVATFTIAAIAAFVSYGHMAGVTARYGETGIVPYLLPISVDGLIVVASVSLVELAGQLRTNPTPAAEAITTAAATGLAEPTPTETRSPTADQPASAPIPAPTMVTATGETRPRHDDRDLVDVEAPNADSADPSADIDDRASDEHPQRVDRQRPYLVPPELAPDLAPLLDAARQARDELLREGRAVTRDALAGWLRANGHAIRTTRIAELLAALKTESSSANGRHLDRSE